MGRETEGGNEYGRIVREERQGGREGERERERERGTTSTEECERGKAGRGGRGTQ